MVNGDLLATGSVTISPPARRHLLSHAAAFGGDQRAGAGAGERLRDLDGRQFASPGIEARHDLKYGHHE